MRRPLTTVIAGMALLLAMAGSFAPTVSAQEGGSLVIGVSQCPEGYEGTDFAADCVEPAADIEFFIGTPNSGNVDSTLSRGDGLVTFALAPFDLNPEGPDTVNVGEPATSNGDYAVACTSNGEPLDIVFETLPFEPGGPLFGITFDFDTGDDIACSWYRLSQPAGGTVDPPADDDDGPVEVLPSTGSGELEQPRGMNALVAAVGSLSVLAGAVVARRGRFSIRSS